MPWLVWLLVSGAVWSMPYRDLREVEAVGNGAEQRARRGRKGQSREGEHVVFTGHSIARRPGAVKGPRVLQPFRGMVASRRDWAFGTREKLPGYAHGE